uniref:FBD domain-containing protein n=1 Tax=Kalanchoe fedtschenkoi TaxID=63787 RepID=A0A7N0V2K4_KALFE
MFRCLMPFHNYLPQLQTIFLRINKLQLKNLPVLSKLKEMSLYMEKYNDRLWRSFIDLAKACPILEFLSISVKTFSKLPDFKNEIVEMEEGHGLDSLRILGVYCNDAEVVDSKLVEYFIGNSPLLVELSFHSTKGKDDLEFNKALKEKCHALSSKLAVQTKVLYK